MFGNLWSECKLYLRVCPRRLSQDVGLKDWNVKVLNDCVVVIRYGRIMIASRDRLLFESRKRSEKLINKIKTKVIRVHLKVMAT